MHIMLADSIDGGILAILVFGGGLVAAVVALAGLVPAWQGNRVVTLVMIAPAFVCGLVITIYCVHGYVTEGLHNPDYELRDFMLPWVFLAGPPLTTSLLAFCVLCYKRAKANRAASDV